MVLTDTMIYSLLNCTAVLYGSNNAKFMDKLRQGTFKMRRLWRQRNNVNALMKIQILYIINLSFVLSFQQIMIKVNHTS